MRKKIFTILLALVIILMNVPITAYADMGPKPSVVIDFKGLEKERYFVTLLSEVPSTGPHSALGEHDNNQRYHKGDGHYDIWEKIFIL